MSCLKTSKRTKNIIKMNHNECYFDVGLLAISGCKLGSCLVKLKNGHKDQGEPKSCKRR